MSDSIPQSIQTPDTVETRLGTLNLRDGAPDAETAAKVYDHLDFSRGVEPFLGSLRGASLAAIRKGFIGNGVQDNDFGSQSGTVAENDDFFDKSWQPSEIEAVG